MKISKADARANFHSIPEIRFEDQNLTAFGGLVVVQALMDRLGWNRRVGRCFAHRTEGKIFTPQVIVSFLVEHLMLGFRRLRDRDYYHEDPLVRRVLGLRRLPDQMMSLMWTVRSILTVNFRLILGRSMSPRRVAAATTAAAPNMSRCG